MLQWWFDDVFGLKSDYLWCFLRHFLNFKDFINIHEHAIEIICISGHGMKGIRLTFNLVPSLVVCDKRQLRYD